VTTTTALICFSNQGCHNPDGPNKIRFFHTLQKNFKILKQYIVDLDDIWGWLGFSRKDPAKRVLQKNFEKDVDYKIIIHQIVINVSSGRPNEQILMNIKTFKKLCLKVLSTKLCRSYDNSSCLLI
jgi:RNAse (barnase) inhibitor barstar